MDDLFKAILQAIEQLLDVGKKAWNGPLSAIGERDQKEDPDYLRKWKVEWEFCLKEIEQKYHRLTLAAKFATNYERNDDVDARLAYFRQMPKMLSETGADPRWSAHYPEISECLNHIHRLLLRIDTKYKLGDHRWDK